MLKVRNTKNLLGVTILGDYEDLSALRDAISNYTNLYMSSQEDPEAAHCYECVLGLCYDLRHAFQGDRGFEAVSNNAETLALMAESIYELSPEAKRSAKETRNLFKNGNLYFSADILYPWAVYYLFLLQSVTEESFRPSWFENIDFDYDEFRAECDEALIRYFVQLLWECVRSILPPEVFRVLWDYSRTFNHTEFYISYPDLYLEWLCHYWAAAAKSRETRVSLLPMMCLELTPISFEKEDDLLKTPDDDDPKYSAYVRSVNQNTLKALHFYDEYYTMSQDLCAVPFLTDFDLRCKLDDHVKMHGRFTREGYDEFLNQTLGEIDWGRIEW